MISAISLQPSWRRWVKRIVFACVSFGVFTMMGFYVFLSPPFAQTVYDRCILRPLKYPGGAYQDKVLAGVTGQDVFFTSTDGKMKLHGRYFQLPGAESTALVSHGIGGNLSSRNDLTTLILNAGASVFIYDYQGYGRSDGVASLTTICDDGLAAYKYLTNDLKVNPAHVIACGESLGTGVTCNLARRVSVAGVILQSPFSCLATRCAEFVPLLSIYPSWLYPASGLNNAGTVGSLKAPVLIVHGEMDKMIPVRHALQVFSSAVEPKQLVVVPKAAHTGDPKLMQSSLYLGAVRHFLATIK